MAVYITPFYLWTMGASWECMICYQLLFHLAFCGLVSNCWLLSYFSLQSCVHRNYQWCSSFHGASKILTALLWALELSPLSQKLSWCYLLVVSSNSKQKHPFSIWMSYWEGPCSGFGCGGSEVSYSDKLASHSLSRIICAHNMKRYMY